MCSGCWACALQLCNNPISTTQTAVIVKLWLLPPIGYTPGSTYPACTGRIHILVSLQHSGSKNSTYTNKNSGHGGSRTRVQQQTGSHTWMKVKCGSCPSSQSFSLSAGSRSVHARYKKGLHVASHRTGTIHYSLCYCRCQWRQQQPAVTELTPGDGVMTLLLSGFACWLDADQGTQWPCQGHFLHVSEENY